MLNFTEENPNFSTQDKFPESKSDEIVIEPKVKV